MDSLRNISLGILHGIVDSIKGIIVVFYLDREMNKKMDKGDIRTKEGLSVDRRFPTGKDNIRKSEESNVMKRVFQCCALNGGIFWLSIIIFEYGLMPCLKLFLTFVFGETSGIGVFLWSWMQPFLSLIFGMIWVLPLFILSKIVNSLWFQDIADSAYKFRKGRPQLIPSISKLIADTLFSLLVQALFLVQSMLMNLVPVSYLGSVLCFVHICLLYSLYSFEYKWFNMGWELHRRLSFIENNWPYFLGFGMPLAFLTQLPSSYIVSGCVFSIAFPIFILSGNEASPAMNTCEFPLRLFSPVVAVSNMFFSRSVRTSKPNVASSSHRPMTQMQTPASAYAGPASAYSGPASAYAGPASAYAGAASTSSKYNAAGFNTSFSSSHQRSLIR